MTTIERMVTDHSGHTLVYCDESDRYGCLECDIWLEDIADCGDPHCYYCSGDAPAKPSLAGSLEYPDAEGPLTEAEAGRAGYGAYIAILDSELALLNAMGGA